MMRLSPLSRMPMAAVGALPRNKTPAGVKKVVVSIRAQRSVCAEGGVKVAGKIPMSRLADMAVGKGGVKTITRLTPLESVTNKLPLGSNARASGRKNWLVMY